MRKVASGLGKKSYGSTGVRKPGNTMCVTTCHDVTLAVKVALTLIQLTNRLSITVTRAFNLYHPPWLELLTAVLTLSHTTKLMTGLVGWLVVFEFNATLTAKVISLRSVTHMCFLAFSHWSVLIQLFFPKPPTTFLTCFYRGERRKYAGKKSGLNRGSNSRPPGHESDTLTTEPPGRG